MSVFETTKTLGLKELLGNDKVKHYLTNIVSKRSFCNSLLFAGPSGVGKRLFAYALAKEIVSLSDLEQTQKQKLASGNHPDIHIYSPEGKVGRHSIEAMRRLKEEVSLKPSEAKHKVFIIHDAERMLFTSANALLKTFEEPPRDTLIILISDYPEKLLPTVLSRCCKVWFEPISAEQIQTFLMGHFNLANAEEITHLSQGSLGKAIDLATKGLDAKRGIILELLSLDKLNYREISAKVKQISDLFDMSKEEWSTELHDKIQLSDLTASQREDLENEVEGIIALKYLEEAFSLLDIVASWYRDLELLRLGGDTKYLLNLDYQQALRKQASQKEMHTLRQIEKIILEVKTALEASTKFSNCFESMFIKLKP